MLDLHGDLSALLTQIVDIESVSGHETPLADAIASSLEALSHLEVLRDGDAVVARTHLGRDQRVVIAGHIDTVPVSRNLPSRIVDGPNGPRVWGRGSVDMKGGVTVQLALAAELSAPNRDVTWVFYDHEEVDASLNGLGRVARNHPDWLAGQFAVLMEPTGTAIEGGCQGTIRVRLTTSGIAAHSARSWLGHNAIHDLTGALEVLSRFEVADVEVDGLVYREGLNATGIGGGVAGNVVPDAAHLDVNYRFAPDRGADEALAQLRDWFVGYEMEIRDVSPGARPGLDRPLAREFADAVGTPPRAKYGWTDVARFTELGIPAVNFGPGDPGLCHADDEACDIADLGFCADALRRWLTA